MYVFVSPAPYIGNIVSEASSFRPGIRHPTCGRLRLFSIVASSAALVTARAVAEPPAVALSRLHLGNGDNVDGDGIELHG